MRLRTSRATMLAVWKEGDVISVTEREAAALEAAGSAERVGDDELELAVEAREAERPERRPRGRPRKQ